MIEQRDKSKASIVQAYAEEFPFKKDAFDCATAVLTIHHWSDIEKGLQRLKADVSSGLWYQRYGDLQQKNEMDYGYRIVVFEV
jgi:hypothetical protein